MKFISDRNRDIHKGELMKMKHKRSIFEKSYHTTFNSVNDAFQKAVPQREREELYGLLCDIALHEIYFSSFLPHRGVSELIKKRYGSEAAFVYSLYECAREADGGFLLVFSDERGRVEFCAGRDYGALLRKRMPILALDREEHAYFLDYQFERESYIRAALSEFNISKIQNTVEKRKNNGIMD